MEAAANGDMRAQVAPANPAQVTELLVELRGELEEYEQAATGETYNNTKLNSAIAAIGAGGQAVGRVRVPEGQTPLNDKLGHPLLDAFNEGVKARDSGARSPYHGHSLEHLLHASGWVQRDLRLALDAALSQPHPADERVVEALRETADALETLLSADPDMPTYQSDYDAADQQLERARAVLSAKEGR